MNELSAKRWALALTSFAAFIVVLDSQVMTVALASIRAELHASIEALQWTVNAYTLTFAVLLLAGSALGERFGRRRIFAGGIALFIAASAACALAPDTLALIVARAIQGVGAALIMPMTIALLGLAYPPAERGKAIGLFTAFTGLALICGPVLGGAITQGLTWHAIFWLNVPLGLIAIPLILARINESSAPAGPFDLAGLALATAGAFGIVWGLIRAGGVGWSDPSALAALIAGIALLIAFVVWEGRARAPMIPLRLFASAAFSAGNATSFLFNAAMYGTLFFLPQFLQTAQHDDPLTAGARVLPWTATLFVFAPISGALVDRVGERVLIIAGLTVQGCGTAWLAAVAMPGTPYPELLGPLILAGAGVSLAMPATQRAILNSVARSDVGKASGVFTMTRYLGGIFGVAVCAAAFNAHGGFTSPQAFGAGFVPAMWVAAAFSFAGAAAGTLIPSPAVVAQQALTMDTR
jgi:EmrB/QacA subfamily drug resistance transporter